MRVVLQIPTSARWLAVVSLTVMCCWSSSATALDSWRPEFRLTWLQGPARQPHIFNVNDVIYVFWLDGKDRNQSMQVMQTLSLDGGLTWLPPRQLTQTTWLLTAFDAAYCNGIFHLVYEDWRSGQSAVYHLRGRNLGENWDAPRRIDSGAHPGRMPSITAGPNGRLHLAYVDSRHGKMDIFYRASTDSGGSWGPEYTVTEPGYIVDNLLPRMCELSDGSVCMAWISNRLGKPQGGWPPTDVMFAISRDSGASWPLVPLCISHRYPASFSECYDVALLADNEDAVHVTWWEDMGGSQLFYRRSNDGGASFGPSIQLSAFGANHTCAEWLGRNIGQLHLRDNDLLVTFSNRLRLGIEFPEWQGDVYVVTSPDRGTSWSAPQRLTTAGASVAPKMAIRQHRPWIVYADERNNYPGNNTMGDELYILLPGPPPAPDGMKIYLAGYGMNDIEEGDGGTLAVLAAIVHPDGPGAIETVEVTYRGQKTGLYLIDDGLHNDFAAGDGLFGLQLPIGPGVPTGEYLLEITAYDVDGQISVWPYLDIGHIARPPAFPTWQTLLRHHLARAAPASNRPYVLYGGYGLTSLDPSAGGELTILALVDDPRGLPYVSSVGLYANGQPTGIYLNDSGPGGGVGDQAPNDGLFTFAIRIWPGELTGADGQYLFEIVARDVIDVPGSWPSLRVIP